MLLLEEYPLLVALAAASLWSVLLFAIGVLFGLWLNNFTKKLAAKVTPTEADGLTAKRVLTTARTQNVAAEEREAALPSRSAANATVGDTRPPEPRPQPPRQKSRGPHDTPAFEQRELQAKLPSEEPPPSSRPADLAPLEVAVPSATPDTLAAASKEIVQTYNSAPQRFERELQWVPMGVLNAKARLSDPRTPLRFAPSAEGYYLVSALGPPYWVIPLPGLVFNKNDLMGMGEVFDCRNYTAGSRYRKITLVRPAKFRQNADGFELEERGQLELDLSEPDN